MRTGKNNPGPSHRTLGGEASITSRVFCVMDIVEDHAGANIQLATQKKNTFSA